MQQACMQGRRLCPRTVTEIRDATRVTPPDGNLNPAAREEPRAQLQQAARQHETVCAGLGHGGVKPCQAAGSTCHRVATPRTNCGLDNIPQPHAAPQTLYPAGVWTRAHHHNTHACATQQHPNTHCAQGLAVLAHAFAPSWGDGHAACNLSYLAAWQQHEHRAAHMEGMRGPGMTTTTAC